MKSSAGSVLAVFLRDKIIDRLVSMVGEWYDWAIK